MYHTMKIFIETPIKTSIQNVLIWNPSMNNFVNYLILLCYFTSFWVLIKTHQSTISLQHKVYFTYLSCLHHSCNYCFNSISLIPHSPNYHVFLVQTTKNPLETETFYLELTIVNFYLEPTRSLVQSFICFTTVQ